jgi:hypothetical protein
MMVGNLISALIRLIVVGEHPISAPASAAVKNSNAGGSAAVAFEFVLESFIAKKIRSPILGLPFCGQLADSRYAKPLQTPHHLGGRDQNRPADAVIPDDPGGSPVGERAERHPDGARGLARPKKKDRHGRLVGPCPPTLARA